MKIFLFLIVSSVFGTAIFYPNRLGAMESINPVSVKTIRLSPETYDGKRIKVSGNIRSLAAARGRIDSEFVIIVLQNSQTELETEPELLEVYSYFIPRINKGTRIVVSGVYHKEGFWAGSRHDHFIEAAEITPVVVN